MTTADEREHACAGLSKEVTSWLISRLAGIKGVGFRGTSDLETEIYGWLWEHAIFEDES